MTSSALHHIGLLFLRIGFSLLLIIGHGVAKIKKLVNSDYTFYDPFGIGEGTALVLATFAEVFFPIFIIIGFKTRLAAIPIIITMLVASFMYHLKDPFSMKEMSLLYLTAFIFILLAGPGKYSVDRR